MEPEDLMLGNWLNYQSLGWDKPQKVMVYNIYRSYIRAYIDNELEEIKIDFSALLTPIPIGDLLKNLHNIEWLSEYHIVIEGWLDLEKLSDDTWSFFIENQLIEVEYFHELQNFFTACKRELSINTISNE